MFMKVHKVINVCVSIRRLDNTNDQLIFLENKGLLVLVVSTLILIIMWHLMKNYEMLNLKNTGIKHVQLISNQQ